MTDHQWRQAWDLYQTASGLNPKEREAFIDSSTDDVEVRCEVRMMLAESAEGSAVNGGAMAKVVAAAAASLVGAEGPGPVTGPQAGDSFGRYTLLRMIGRGGMGEVYEASDAELDRKVALKFLRVGGLARQNSMERFIDEAHSLSALNHPNIVTVHEVLKDGGHVAIVMELVEGKPLRQLCGDGPMDLFQVAETGRQVALALEAAHARGIVHGDIKPENVMVRPDGYAKVLDFGLAKRIEAAASGSEGRNHSSIFGTFRYMAPEQMRSEPVTPASDVYSLGLLLYEMASGRHPFGDEPGFAGLARGSLRTPEALAKANSGIPASFDRLILWMLMGEGEARPTAPQVVAQLEELVRTLDPRNAAAAAAAAARGKGLAGRAIAASVCGAILVLGGTLWFGLQSRAKSSGGGGAPVEPRPLTSQLGRETEPALSPTGDWIAYLWTDDSGRNPGLYSRSLASDASKELMAGSELAIRAIVFSPAGKRIAFRRQDGIFTIPREGSAKGAERVADSLGGCEGSGLDWSPDGKSMLLAECPKGSALPALIEIDLSSGVRRALTDPPASTQGDYDPRYSPDGSQIAFRRALQPVVEDIYVLNLRSSGAQPMPISRDARGISGLAWMPDGKSLLVSSQRSGGFSGLWRFYPSKPFEPEAFAQAGQHAKMPTVARRGTKLAWINQVIDHNIWELPVQPGTLVPAGPPRRLIASLQRDVDCHVGPDGRIAFRSDRSGVSEIWIAKPDGSNPVRVTSMNGPLTGTPRWSPDGRYLAFDSRPGNTPMCICCVAMRWDVRARRSGSRIIPQPMWCRRGRGTENRCTSRRAEAGGGRFGRWRWKEPKLPCR
jgi:eukaryotic-like serine/threonine-protein kinase